MKSSVLIATADADTQRILEPALRERQHRVFVTDDGAGTLRRAHERQPAIVLLDAILPPTDGLDVCRDLRGDTDTAELPIVMIAAGSQPAERVAALDAGADDCVARPVAVDELLARLRALQRRLLYGQATARLQAGPISIDLDRWLVRVEDRTVNLTKMEFLLLCALLEAKGRTLTREFLLQRVSPRNARYRFDTRTVDVHIGRLRHKLGHAGHSIITVRNVGFRFEVMPEWLTTLHIVGSDHAER